MRALVTGGCGFIGSNLVRSLVDRGHRVDVVDDLSTGDVSNLAGLNLRNLMGILGKQ
jgi:UDP-glucose 4-epimerase